MPVESVREVFVVWVDVVEDRISVGLMAGGENDNLEVLDCLLQALHEVGTKVDARTDSLFAWEVDLENHVRVLSVDVIDAVDQGFVQIEDQKLLVVLRRRWQKDELVFYLFFWHDAEVHDVAKCLLGLFEVLLVLVFVFCVVFVLFGDFGDETGQACWLLGLILRGSGLSCEVNSHGLLIPKVQLCVCTSGHCVTDCLTNCRALPVQIFVIEAGNLSLKVLVVERCVYVLLRLLEKQMSRADNTVVHQDFRGFDLEYVWQDQVCVVVQLFHHRASLGSFGEVVFELQKPDGSGGRRPWELVDWRGLGRRNSLLVPD